MAKRKNNFGFSDQILAQIRNKMSELSQRLQNLMLVLNVLSNTIIRDSAELAAIRSVSPQSRQYAQLTQWRDEASIAEGVAHAQRELPGTVQEMDQIREKLLTFVRMLGMV